MHCENAFGKSLFGLLFWEIIFASEVPYVWQTPYQAVPLDFGTKDFYLQRQELIDDRINQLSSLKSDQLESEINSRYEQHKNKHNVLVAWDSVKLTGKRLAEIGSILGGNKLSKIMLNYAIDYKFWNHGMPDLILWSKEQEIVKFSEVKSENDRLSDV